MQIITFDALRSFGIPGIHYIRPDNWLSRLPEIEAADWLLFPEYDQVNALHYGLHKRLFPSIATYHLGHDKAQQTRALQLLCPQHLPETWLLPRSEANLAWVRENLPLPLVGKEIRSSMGRGVQLLETPADLRRYAEANPLLYLQEWLPIDRDLRLVLIGRKVVAGYWRLQPEGGFQTNVAQGGRIEAEHVPPAAVALAEAVAVRLGIDHAGFDLAEVEGHFYFFEFNRLFGTQGLAELGVQTGPLIHAYLQSLTLPPETPEKTPPTEPPLRQVG